ncbi:MAG: putative transporter, substrate binding protein [Devosia sp.]|nr:putative transporter, substrate binding protein [Devosia sp.]
MTEFLLAKLFKRRSVLGAALAVPVAIAASKAFAVENSVDAETAAIDELYEAAKAEVGKLIVYAGGDRPWDSKTDEFMKRFPEIDLNIIIDYSKFHDVRLDNQFATGSVTDIPCNRATTST